MPTDAKARAKVEAMAGLGNRKRFLSTYYAMWHTLWTSFIFGSIYLALAQLFPKKVFNWVYVIGGGVFALAGILVIA